MALIDTLAPTQEALDDVRLRFTSVDGGSANVRQAYYAVATADKAWTASWGNAIRTDSTGDLPQRRVLAGERVLAGRDDLARGAAGRAHRPRDGVRLPVLEGRRPGAARHQR